MEVIGVGFKNSKKFMKLIGIALIVILSYFSSFSFGGIYEVRAETNKNNVIILLDNSGSMQSGIGDLAKIACSMAVDCIDSDKVNMGIITFGEKVTVLNDISQSQDVSKLKRDLKEITFNEDYTNMKDGLKEAINQLSKVSGKKSILILSDGVETAEGGLAPDHGEQLNELSQEAEGQEIKVNSVALSEEVEREFLNSIAIKTGGTFRDGKTADKLFEAISSIIALENEFITVGNYSTLNKNSEKIKISEIIEEGVINVAAADNIEPNLEVRLNGKVLEPSKEGNLYQVYKFSNSSSSEIEIIQKGDMNTSVIVQLKSKAKLNVLGDSQNYLSLPINIPRKINMTLECGENEIPEGTFIQRDGYNIQQSSKRGVFQDIYEGKEPGEQVIRYTAKDGNGGIIAIAQLVVSINNYPPYDYKDPMAAEKVVSGDKVSISIEPKGKEKVRELGGTLIINRGQGHEELPLVEENGVLTAEFEAEEPGAIEYYAYVRGIREEDNTSFEYKLEGKTIEILENPIINLGLKDESRKRRVINSNENIIFQVMANSLIEDETKVLVLNSKSKEIGNFTVRKDTKEVTLKIPLKELTDNLTLRFKTDTGVQVTDTIETNIEVISKVRYIWDKYLRTILIIALILALIAGAIIGGYFISMKAYERYIGDNERKNIEISYKIKPSGFGDSLSGVVSSSNKYLYINFSPTKSKVTLDEEPMNITLGDFRYENIYEGHPRWIQGLKCLIFKKKRAIVTHYSASEEQRIYLNDNETETTSITEQDERRTAIRIIYSINKKFQIEVEFNL